MKRTIAVSTVCLMFGLATSGLGQGVQTGTIRGTVKDQQDLAVPGVTITATSPAMQGPRSTTTETDGLYVLRDLPAGDYEVKFELSGFAPVIQKTIVPLGGVAEANTVMRVGGIADEVTITAEAPTVLTTATVGANVGKQVVDSIPIQRNLAGIATLSPGLSANTPDQGQVAINGGFAFDNIFMLNGVDINDNLFAQPQDLFIEDAIQETQVLTSGISAEYGRFTGGVVNAITKSGGNAFSGSYRLNLFNNAWGEETPFETAQSIDRPSKTNLSHEGTFGGPLAKDRLWFFLAGRHQNTSSTRTLDQTGFQYDRGDKNNRGEAKVTAKLSNNHTFVGTYINNDSEVSNLPPLSISIDPHTLTNQTYPNWLYAANWHGILKSNLLAEAQVSRRHFAFLGGGGTSSNIVDSPFINPYVSGFTQYNAPYFDATDPEERNNQQVTGNVTYFLTGKGLGRMEIKSGYEWFRSQRTGGNSQSSTNSVFWTDYAMAGNKPAVDANGYLIPVFTEFGSFRFDFFATRGAVLNIDTNSVYVQDHWAINSNWSADLGFRYERARSKSTGGILGVNTDTWVPRFALAWDPKGDGKTTVHATYGHYAGRYHELLAGANSPVGNPNELDAVYIGPPGQGREFAPGFSPDNYVTYFAYVPLANVFMADGLHSPVTKEFTTSAGTTLGAAGSFQATYVWRQTRGIIEDFITLENETTDIVLNDVPGITATNIVFRNSDIPRRDYQGLVFQGRYGKQNWSVNGNWTVQLKNDGNYEGEAAQQPGSTSPIGDYPEAFNEQRNFPYGHLAQFQRNKIRLWTIYDWNFGQRGGSLTSSALWRVDSALYYSLVAGSQELTEIQFGRLAAYPDPPATQDLYFNGRGTEPFKGYGLLDISLGYNIPVWRRYRPYVKFDVYNVLNNNKLIVWNTTITADPVSPKDSLGLATGYIKDESFGTAAGNTSFPVPFGGQTGLRTYRVALGFRF